MLHLAALVSRNGLIVVYVIASIAFIAAFWASWHDANEADRKEALLEKLNREE